MSADLWRKSQPMTAPETPQLQLVAFDGHTASIKWEKPKNGLVDYYQIHYRDSRSNKDVVVKSKNEEITLSSLTQGCTYFVAVETIVNADVTGLRSRSSSLEFTTAPLAPTNLQLQLFTDNSVSIRFEDSDPAKKEYMVTFHDLKHNDDWSQMTKTQFLCQKLKPGHVYDIFVQAIIKNPFFSGGVEDDIRNHPRLSAIGSDYEEFYDSSTASAVAGSKSIQQVLQELYSVKSISKVIWTYPDRVENVKHNQCSHIHSIEWQAVDGAHSYEIKWTNSSENSEFRLLPNTDVMLANLKLGSVYTVSVAAINEAGKGQYSKATQFKTEPPVPTDIAVKHHELFPHTSLMVSFKEVASDADALYTITAQCVSQPGTKIAETKTSVGVLEDLIPGASYKIYVTAKQGDLHSKKSYYPDFIQTYPDKPDSVKLEAESIDRLVYVWKSSQVKPKHYKVVVKEYGVKTIEDTTSTESFIIEKPNPATIYKVFVSAVNDAGCGEASESDEHTTAPAAPVNVLVRNNPINPKTSLIVSYEDPDPAKKQYKIKTCDAAGVTVGEITTNEKTAVINELKPGNIYKVLIIAMFREKESAVIEYP